MFYEIAHYMKCFRQHPTAKQRNEYVLCISVQILFYCRNPKIGLWPHSLTCIRRCIYISISSSVIYTIWLSKIQSRRSGD
ncbi:hypothetical protein GDO86_001078 [Hymenochirus boettgeri]|uniref:Uncharacterized protein n=1 Tax=Hymenochirus boettgeri TaxID=247094 RepID=A0A8T2KC67_9PIPI|nr:hypothetical protein GDO86_001078 [Hymenochirus boettgeri]